MIKTFISYHHEKDRKYYDHLSDMARRGAFKDRSVKAGEINDKVFTDEAIRRYIRDKHLKDTQVTILLCGKQTKDRKHIDWELLLSMTDGEENKRSGILVVNLPDIGQDAWCAALGDEEKKRIYSDCTEWDDYKSRGEFMRDYPYMPERIIDNLAKSGVQISVVPWRRIKNDVSKLRFLVEKTAKVGPSNKYDCSKPMRKKNRNR